MAADNVFTSLLGSLADLVLQQMPAEGEKSSFLESLFFVRRDDPEFCWHGISKPTASLVCQGSKIIQRGQKQNIAEPGEMIITCVDIPDTVCIANVSDNKPFLCIYFLLDRKIFIELLSQMSFQHLEETAQEATSPVYSSSPQFLETICRAAKAATNPEDARIIGPLLLKELHYLLLKSPAGASLRTLYMGGSQDSRIIEAINYLKRNLDRPVAMEELARAVYMSVSSLHRHFRKVTGFSPLQYHKELRLYEAQRLMLVENERADAAAQAVGYESVNQFSREYKRKFGLPPHQAIKALRDIFSGASGDK